MNNCSCNKKYLGEGCIELPSEFGSYFLVLNLFKELDTEEKRLIALLNLGLDENLNKIIKLVPTDTSEENKLVNQEQLTQAVLSEASERENAIRELDNKIPVFTNEQLETLNSGITSEDKTALYNNITMSNTMFGRTDELLILAGKVSLHSEASRFQHLNDVNIRTDEINVSNIDTSNGVITSTVFVTPETVKFYLNQLQDGLSDITKEQVLTIDDVEKLHSFPTATDLNSTLNSLDGLTRKITIPKGTNNLYVDNFDDDVQIDADHLIQNAKHDVSISSRNGSIEIKSFDDLTLSADEGNHIMMNIDDGGSIVINIGETQLTLDEYKLLKLISLLNNN